MPSVFGYWNLRGLGQAGRLLLEYTGEDYRDDRYDAINGRDKWIEHKERNPHGLAFPNLPYYVDGDVRLTQSTAILRHLARKHHMAGNSDEEHRQLDMLEGQVGDLRLFWSYLFYGTEKSYQEMLPSMRKRIVDNLSLLDKYLSTKKWFIGDRLTYIDFMLYDLFSIYKIWDCSLIESCPHLTRLMKDFEALPAIKKYMASDRFIKWPLNGPSAWYGGK